MIKRIGVYLIGLLILALGITLNTKTQLGVSPIVSVAYNVSEVSGIALGIMTFVFYSLMVGLQAILLKKDFKSYQLLQIAVSFVTSLFIQFFNQMIPVCHGLMLQLTILVLAIILTGIGAALTVAMKLVPNPADGLASVIGKKLNKNFGFGKNVFDMTSIVIALLIGFVCKGEILGIGLGTICSMVLTGRVVALMQQPADKVYISVCESDDEKVSAD